MKLIDKLAEEIADRNYGRWEDCENAEEWSACKDGARDGFEKCREMMLRLIEDNHEYFDWCSVSIEQFTNEVKQLANEEVKE